MWFMAYCMRYFHSSRPGRAYEALAALDSKFKSPKIFTMRYSKGCYHSQRP